MTLCSWLVRTLHVLFIEEEVLEGKLLAPMILWFESTQQSLGWPCELKIEKFCLGVKMLPWEMIKFAAIPSNELDCVKPYLTGTIKCTSHCWKPGNVVVTLMSYYHNMLCCNDMQQCGARLILGTIVTFPNIHVVSYLGEEGEAHCFFTNVKPQEYPKDPKPSRGKVFRAIFTLFIYTLCRPGQGYMEQIHY